MSIPITKFSAAIARRENEGAERQRRIDELEEQSHQYAAAVVNFLRANAASAFTAEEIARAIGALDWYEAERLHYENPSAVYSSFFPSGHAFSLNVSSFTYCLGRAQGLCRDIHSENVDGVMYYCCGNYVLDRPTFVW